MSVRGLHHAQITIPRGREDDARAFSIALRDRIGVELVEPDERADQ